MKLKSLLLSLLLNFLPFNIVLAEFASSNLNDYVEDTNLISPDTKIDYNSLAQLLAKGEWRKANEETRALLLEASGRADTGWMMVEDIQKLSCWDLKTIDQLWQKYSQGRFGFSVQLPIYLQTGNRPGKLISDENYLDFGDRLGWRKDGDWIIFIENLNYSLDAPPGHLPNPRPEYSITGGRLQYTSFAERMVNCNLTKK
jgi:hypothetical protein